MPDTVLEQQLHSAKEVTVKDPFTRLLDLTLGWGEYVEQDEAEHDDCVKSADIYAAYQSVAEFAEPYWDALPEVQEMAVRQFVDTRLLPLLLVRVNTVEMERLKQEVEVWLHEQFPQSQVLLDVSLRGANVGGYLVWEGFTGEEPIDRQRHLSRVVRDHFDTDNQRMISLIVTLTPAEYAVHCEPQMG